MKSFARKIREAWHRQRDFENNHAIMSWQLRLRLAKHFYQGVSDDPPANQYFSGAVRGSTGRASTSQARDAFNTAPESESREAKQ